MKRAPLTVRNLRILQIGILAVLCLSLVLAAVLGGRCDAADVPEGENAARFHATELQTAFTDAGFLADGNLYAYTLTPSDGTNVSVAVQLSTVNAQNDTVTLRFPAVSGTENRGGSSLTSALRAEAADMRLWYEALLDALTTALIAANAGVMPEGADTVKADVLSSIDSGKTLHLEAGAFVIDAGYTEPDAPNLYVLRIKAAG